MKARREIMTWFSRMFIALLLVAGSSMCYAQATEITQDELAQRLKSEHAGLVVDVRSPEEYAEGHVPGAINIPHEQLQSRLAEISAHKDKEVVLYCKSARRAGIAADILQAAGFGKVLHLQGDMSGWLGNPALPVEK